MAVLFSKLHELAQSRATNTTFSSEKQGGFYLEPGQHESTLLNYEWLRKDMVDRDAEEMIDMATKHIMDQQREVQTNIHSELKNICTIIDMILGKNGPPTTIQVHGSPSHFQTSTVPVVSPVKMFLPQKETKRTGFAAASVIPINASTSCIS